MILHVYQVTLANPDTLDATTETVVAMNTAEARDQMIARYGVPAEDAKRFVWHVHEVTKFLVREEDGEDSANVTAEEAPEVGKKRR